MATNTEARTEATTQTGPCVENLRNHQLCGRPGTAYDCGSFFGVRILCTRHQEGWK